MVVPFLRQERLNATNEANITTGTKQSMQETISFKKPESMTITLEFFFSKQSRDEWLAHA